MISKELAQQALEALEVSTRFVYADLRPQCEEAITVLRAALADEAMQRLTDVQQEMDCYGDGNVYRGQRSRDSETKTITFSKAETVEPVAYVTGFTKGRCTIALVDPAWTPPVGMALYRSPPNQSEDALGMVEPVAWMWKYRRLDGSVVRVTTYRNQHPPKELDFILENLGEDAIPLYAENPLQNIHPKTGTTACLMQSPEFRLTPWSEK